MSELVAATGDSVARIVDQGDGWAVSFALEGSGAQCVARDGAAGVLWAGCRNGGLWRASEDATGWGRSRLPHDDVFSVAVSPVDGRVYAGCEPSMLFVSRDAGRSWRELESLRQIPSAPTWSFPPRPWTSHVRWIAPSPHDADLLLVGIELGGVMRSEDGGETWADHARGAQRDVHALAWHPDVPGRAYEAGGGGAAWSFDGGLTWQPADAGRDRHYTWALAVDPQDPDCWWISASVGPRYAHGDGDAKARLYRWRDRGPWEERQAGIRAPLAMPYALVVRDGRLFAGLRDGRICASSDAGDTWQELALDKPLRSIIALV